MDQKAFVHGKNKLMLLLIAISVGLGIVDNLITGKGLEALFVIAGIGGIFIGLMSYLVRQKKDPNIAMFLSVLFIEFMVLAFVMLTPGIFSYFTIYLSLFLVSLYQDYKPVILSGVMNVFISTWGLIKHNQVIFPNYSETSHIFTFAFLIALSTLLIILQCKNSQRMQREIEKNQKEIETNTQKMHLLFEDITQNAKALKPLSEALDSTSCETTQLSNRLNHSLSDMGKAIESTAENTQQINEHMKANGDSLTLVKERSERMKNLSHLTRTNVENGQVEMDQLNESLIGVESEINEAVSIMKSLEKEIDRIEEILSTVSSIAEQTNLLALNASIESARAGEAGRGFAVVAEEIRKLAIESKNSNKRIADILNAIASQSGNATEKIIMGQTSVAKSREKSERAKIEIFSIGENVGHIRNQSDEVDIMLERVNDAFGIIMGQVENISAISEENTASVEEMVQASTEQFDQVKFLKSKQEDLNAVVEHLFQIVQKK